MHKTTLLTIAIITLAPLSSFSSTFPECRNTYVPLPLSSSKCYDISQEDARLTTTHLESNHYQAPKKRHRTVDARLTTTHLESNHYQAPKNHTCTQEEHNFILCLVIQITSHHSINFFENADITETHQLYCPQFSTFFISETPVLRKETLELLIREIKEFINPAYLLPPSTTCTLPYKQTIPQELISLKSAEELYDRLVKITTPQEDEFLHLTDASLKSDGTVYLPELERVITMNRLLEILTSPTGGKLALSSLSFQMQAHAHDTFQRTQEFASS